MSIEIFKPFKFNDLYLKWCKKPKFTNHNFNKYLNARDQVKLSGLISQACSEEIVESRSAATKIGVRSLLLKLKANL